MNKIIEPHPDPDMLRKEQLENPYIFNQETDDIFRQTRRKLLSKSEERPMSRADILDAISDLEEILSAWDLENEYDMANDK